MSRAADVIASGDIRAILKMALDSRAAADEGRYCECIEPDLTGAGLMCPQCLLRNKDQERASVTRIVEAHDFVPHEKVEFMCAVCSMWQDSPRHHGVPDVGRTSWGEEIRPER